MAMRFLRSGIGVLAAALLGAACGAPGAGGDGTAASAPDSAFFADRWAEYSRALTSEEVEEVVDLYTEDARLMEPGLATIGGRSTIRNVMTSALKRVDLTRVEMRTREVRVHGDRAYEVGSYREDVEPVDGSPRRQLGRYVAFWERNDDAWRVSLLMLNSVPAGLGGPGASPDSGEGGPS